VNELEGMQKETVFALFEVTPRKSQGITDENHKITQSG
jgi:hypothetical protein